MLFETVREAQKGSEEAKLELVERFQPTIRANAWKLNREDGKEEMTLAFLEILESMNLEKLRSREDGVIVAYFKNALRHAYCHEKEKEVLTLIYYAGYSATEIAAAWGTSKQNVNQIKRRGLGKLKKSLQGEFF